MAKSVIQKDVVAQRARGYWQSIILQLSPGVQESHLSGRHGPCPKCGGKDRFRVMADFPETGGAFCGGGVGGQADEGCFSRRNGDGFAFLMWFNGWTFPKAIEEVAKALGMVGSRGKFDPDATPPKSWTKTPTKNRDKKPDPFTLWEQRDVAPDQLSAIVHRFANARDGVDAGAVLASDPMVGRWRDSDYQTHDVIGFKGWNADSTGKLKPCALHIYRQDGRYFPACERGSSGKDRKNHNVYGSTNGWVFVGGYERFKNADVIFKVEGLTDAFALLPLLLPHHSIVTMTNGCHWSAGSDRMPPLSIFNGRRVVSVGDADIGGQAGAMSFTADAVRVAEEVFVWRLPYPLQRSEGPDLRDWLTEDEWTWPDIRCQLREWGALLRARLNLFGEGARSTSKRSFAVLDQTDKGNSNHYAAYSRNLLRYHYSWRKWLCWDGMRWRADDQGRPVAIAKRVIGEMEDDAREMHNEMHNGMSWVAKSSGRERINAMIDLSRDCLPVQTEQLDQDGWALNCPNGTVDLRSGELRMHTQDDYITKLCDTPFDVDAQAPRWEQFLEEVFAQELDVIPFLQRFFGYCLTGDISEQKLPVFWGDGSNGKSTLLNTVKEVIGVGYTMQAQPDMLIDRKVDQHPTELAGLFGKRLVICAETEDSKRLAEAKLKSLTGGEPVMARRMREDFWEFIPECKIILVTNHKPQVWGQDRGIWRRLLLVPFLETFTEETKDPLLMERLAAERPGILAWMVRGCMEWQQIGLAPPDSIVQATKDYADSEDVVGRFVADCCVVGDGCEVRAKALNKRYDEWKDEGGEPPLSAKRIGQWLTRRGFGKRRSGGIVWVGIGLLADDPPILPDEESEIFISGDLK